MGGGGAAAATLTHRVGVTHHPWVVGTPARWAETNYPAGINLGQWPTPHSHRQCTLVAEALVILPVAGSPRSSMIVQLYL